jgi:prepilin-type N-terminal cleavage/methylation domain-containing protein
MGRRKGFTLMEITVVLFILGILIAIAIPNYISYTSQGAANAAEQNLIAIYNAQKNFYFANNAVYCTDTTPVKHCGDNRITLNKNLNLNINDSYFQYECYISAGNVPGCIAKNNSAPQVAISLYLSSPIVLTGATGCATSSGAGCNPICNGAAYCPTS